MYNANATYEENYKNGPDKEYLPGRVFPQIEYLSKPKFEFLGIPFHIPFGVAAGPLLNSKFVEVALNAGFCMPVYKTVRSQTWECNDWPNVLLLKSKQESLFADKKNLVIGVPFENESHLEKNISISNSFGVPSKDSTQWIQDFSNLAPFANKSGKHVVLSFQGSRVVKESSKESKNAFFKDLENVTRLVSHCVLNNKFSLLELNLSCPNEACTPLYKDLQSAIEVVKLVKRILNSLNLQIKLIVKIGVLNLEETQIFMSETAGEIDAISAINTISADILSPKGEFALGSGQATGGVCGALIFEQGVKMVARLAEVRQKLGLSSRQLGIIGVGGVRSANEFQTYLSSGADMVHAATGMMWNLELAQEIAEFLKVSFRQV